MTNSPLVSIITPTFNRAQLLSQAIDSVLKQTYPNFEMLIIDNGSTDNTRAIVENFKEPRIHYFYQENSGSPVSPRNRGFKNAKGDIICILDSDDLWLTNKLELQVEEFQKKPSVGLVYSDCFLINPEGKISGLYSDYHQPFQGSIFAHLLRSNFIPAVTVSFRKKMVGQFGFLNEDYLIAHDFDFYLKIANKYPIGYIPQPLAKLRIHRSSLSQNRIKSYMEIVQVIKPWCQEEKKTSMSARKKKQTWAFRCFMLGMAMLNFKESKMAGRTWLKEAFFSHPFHPIYWTAFLFSFAPTEFIKKILQLAKKRWSVETAII